MFKTLIGALALAATVPAAAAETRVVRYDDLNLASPAGMERLERRIQTAARAVCGVTTAQQMRLDEFTRSRACMAEAKAKAAQQIAAIEARESRGG